MAFIYFRTFWFGGHLCVKDFFVSGHLLSGHLVVEAFSHLCLPEGYSGTP